MNCLPETWSMSYILICPTILEIKSSSCANNSPQPVCLDLADVKAKVYIQEGVWCCIRKDTRESSESWIFIILDIQTMQFSGTVFLKKGAFMLVAKGISKAYPKVAYPKTYLEFYQASMKEPFFCKNSLRL